MLAPSYFLFRRPIFLTLKPHLSRSKKLLFSATYHQRSQATSTATSFQQWRRAAITRNDNMATPNKVHLTVHDTGIVKLKPQTAESAAKTSELLQENHEARPSK